MNSSQATPVVEETRDKDFVPTTAGAVDGVLMPIYVIVLIAYSIGASWLSGCPWYTFIVFYVAFMLAFYGWHLQAHHPVSWVPFNRPCRTYHKQHHWQFFPPEAFYGTAEALAAGQDAKVMSSWVSALPLASSPAHEAFLYMLFAVIMGAGVLAGLSRLALAFALFEAAIIGVVGNYLHISFHVKEHWLGCHPWTRDWWHELQAMHYVHHVGSAKQNFAMVNFALDRIFRTFFEAPEEAVHSKSAAKPAAPLDSAADTSATAAPSLERIHAALRTSPMSHALFMGEATTAPSRALSMRPALSRGPAAVLARVVIVVLLFTLYHELQTVLPAPPSLPVAFGIRDAGLSMTAGVHEWLSTRPIARAATVAVSALLTDVAALALVAAALLGTRVRPVLAVGIALIARAVTAAVTALPPPPGGLWFTPQWHTVLPGLAQATLVSGASGPHVQFFSGAAALGAIAACEVIAMTARIRHRPTAALVIASVVAALTVNCAALLALRVHWSADILAGLLVGRYAHLAAQTYTPFFDSALP